MEPSTILPPTSLCEGYGLEDESLDRLLMTTGYREVSLHYRPAIETVQTAFNSVTRIRIIALPLSQSETATSPHLAWVPLWSNKDTCTLIANPCELPSRHDDTYLIPRGFAEHFAHTVAGYPYFMPSSTPDQFWPSYLDCQPISPASTQPITNMSSHSSDKDQDATIFAILLETLIRLRGYVADHLLIEQGFINGVAYHHNTLLYELPIPDFAATPDAYFHLSFLLLDAARAVTTLSRADYLTQKGLANLIGHTRTQLCKLDHLVSALKPGFFVSQQFDKLYDYFRKLHTHSFHDPLATCKALGELLRYAGIPLESD